MASKTKQTAKNAAPGAKASAKGRKSAAAETPAEAPKMSAAESAALGAAEARRRRESKKPSVRASNRLRVFKALAKAAPVGLPAGQLREQIGMSPANGALGVILRGEMAGKRIKRQNREDAAYYTLSEKGLAALEAGEVDSGARALGLLKAGRSWESRGE
jgi:hypothetical protein